MCGIRAKFSTPSSGLKLASVDLQRVTASASRDRRPGLLSERAPYAQDLLPRAAFCTKAEGAAAGPALPWMRQSFGARRESLCAGVHTDGGADAGTASLCPHAPGITVIRSLGNFPQLELCAPHKNHVMISGVAMPWGRNTSAQPCFTDVVRGRVRRRAACPRRLPS